MVIDISRIVGAVTREISTCEFKGKPARRIGARRNYNTSIEDLWDTLTNAERIPRWFMPISGVLRLGGRYQLQGNAGGEITKCEAPRALALTWEFGGEISWVEIELKANATNQAELCLDHLSLIPDDDQFWKKYGPGATGVGWEQALWGLELYLAKDGASIQAEEAEAWLSSEDGKSYIQQCSEAWAQVAIATGTDPAIAEAAAHQTTRFYTGS